MDIEKEQGTKETHRKTAVVVTMKILVVAALTATLAEASIDGRFVER
jgi:hypothetical protein